MIGLVGVVATAGFGSATAGETQLPGRPVPVAEARTIAAAALSCPALTPAKLAGQLMAGSGFDTAARNGGGAGLAGLTDVTWQRWKPRVSAQRTDPDANITALAHLTCDLVGQMRQAGIGGDPWRLALGAYHSGIDAVRAAKGVPGPARQYVDTVAAYAAWYAHQPIGAAPSPNPSKIPNGVVPSHGTPPVRVPDDYVPMVLAAGRDCPAVTPPRIAAQLMASSGFNPNLLGAQGGQGIAQFTPERWARSAPYAAASVWDPSVAVPALGRVMCELVGETAGLGKDPYVSALAAFQAGPDAVRQAGGVPDAPGVRAYLDLVAGYATYYGTDTRLGGRPAGVPSRTPSAAPAPSATGKNGTALSTAPAAPDAQPSTARTSTPHTPTPTHTTTPAKPDWQTRVINATAVLRPGQAWTTNRLNFALDRGGNIVLYDQGRLVWNAGTGGKGVDHLVFQNDGHLVLYSTSGTTLWSSHTAGNNGAILVLQNDGNVTLSLNGRVLWQTGTGT